MVSSPTAVHESVLDAMKASLTFALATIPVPRQILRWAVKGNNYVQRESVRAIPNLTIKLHHGQVRQEIWLLECAFSQSDESVMKKLEAYVWDIPDLLVVGKILIQETSQYCSLGANAAKDLQSSELMMQAKFTSSSNEEKGFAQIVVDKHTWFDLASVELHVWVRQAGKSAINLKCPKGDGYASGVCCYVLNMLINGY